MRRQNSMIFGKCKLHTIRSGVMQILSKFCHKKTLNTLDGATTIMHCINDDTSFLRESCHSCDIKYWIL